MDWLRNRKKPQLINRSIIPGPYAEN